MKRSLALLFTSLLLALSLTACGRDRQPGGSPNDSAGTNGDAITGTPGTAGTNGDAITDGAGTDGSAVTGNPGAAGTNDDAVTGTPGAAGTNGDAITNGAGTDGSGTLADDAANALKKGVNDIADGAARMGGASYQQMLRNARVHDADGDLKDRENAVTPGSAY